MQHFKTFFKIARKQLGGIIIYFIIYAVIMTFLGSAANNTVEEAFKTKSLDIAIIDRDNTSASKALHDYLGDLHKIMDCNDDETELEDLIYYRVVKYVLIIPEGFEANLLAGKTDGILNHLEIKGTAAGYFVGDQIDQYLVGINTYLYAGEPLENAISLTNQAIKNSQRTENVSFATEGDEPINTVFFRNYQYLPYIYIAMLICGMAPILVIFNKKEIHNRIGCSSSTFSSISLQIALGCIVYSLLVWLCFELVIFVLHGKVIFGRMALLALPNTVVFMLFATGLALFISTFAPSIDVLNMIANVVGLASSFLCGVFVPQYMLSKGVLSAARFLPTYWYIKCNDLLSGYSSDIFSMNKYYTYLGIQFLFVIAIFALYLFSSRMRKQNAAA